MSGPRPELDLSAREKQVDDIRLHLMSLGFTHDIKCNECTDGKEACVYCARHIKKERSNSNGIRSKDN